MAAGLELGQHAGRLPGLHPEYEATRCLGIGDEQLMDLVVRTRVE